MRPFACREGLGIELFEWLAETPEGLNVAREKLVRAMGKIKFARRSGRLTELQIRVGKSCI